MLARMFCKQDDETHHRLGPVPALRQATVMSEHGEKKRPQLRELPHRDSYHLRTICISIDKALLKSSYIKRNVEIELPLCKPIGPPEDRYPPLLMTAKSVPCFDRRTYRNHELKSILSPSPQSETQEQMNAHEYIGLVPQHLAGPHGRVVCTPYWEDWRNPSSCAVLCRPTTCGILKVSSEWQAVSEVGVDQDLDVKLMSSILKFDCIHVDLTPWNDDLMPLHRLHRVLFGFRWFQHVSAVRGAKCQDLL